MKFLCRLTERDGTWMMNTTAVTPGKESHLEGLRVLLRIAPVADRTQTGPAYEEPGELDPTFQKS